MRQSCADLIASRLSRWEFKMTKESIREEWWADIAEPYVRLARLQVKADGRCEVLDIDGETHAFGSYSEAETWLCEDEYSRVSALIAEGELPCDFAVPSAVDHTELLTQMRDRGPELQPFIDQNFFNSLGPERQDVSCRRAGCTSGAIELSSLCRHHHFENVIGRPYTGSSGY
jgi:hypothetical protein